MLKAIMIISMVGALVLSWAVWNAVPAQNNPPVNQRSDAHWRGIGPGGPYPGYQQGYVPHRPVYPHRWYRPYPYRGYYPPYYYGYRPYAYWGYYPPPPPPPVYPYYPGW